MIIICNLSLNSALIYCGCFRMQFGVAGLDETVLNNVSNSIVGFLNAGKEGGMHGQLYD